MKEKTSLDSGEHLSQQSEGVWEIRAMASAFIAVLAPGKHVAKGDRADLDIARDPQP